MHKWVFGRFGWRAIDLRTPYGLVRRTLTILSKAPSYRVATFEESETTLHTWFPLPRNPPPDAWGNPHLSAAGGTSHRHLLAWAAKR